MKKWYESKTMWVNILSAVGAVALVVGVEISAENQAEIVAGILAAVNVVNIVLRKVTDKGIE